MAYRVERASQKGFRAASTQVAAVGALAGQAAAAPEESLGLAEAVSAAAILRMVVEAAD
jgi:hypothetical protein